VNKLTSMLPRAELYLQLKKNGSGGSEEGENTTRKRCCGHDNDHEKKEKCLHMSE